MTSETLSIKDLHKLYLESPYDQIAPVLATSLVEANLCDIRDLCGIPSDEVGRARELRMFLEHLGRRSTNHFEGFDEGSLATLQEKVSEIPTRLVHHAVNQFLGLEKDTEQIDKIIQDTSFLDCLEIVMEARRYGNGADLVKKVIDNQEVVRDLLNKLAPDWIKEKLTGAKIVGESSGEADQRVRELVSRLKNLSWAISKLPQAILTKNSMLLDPNNPDKPGIFNSWNGMVNSFNEDSVNDGITIEGFSHDELVELRAAFEILKDFLA